MPNTKPSNSVPVTRQQASVRVYGSGQTGWVVEWLRVNNQITPTAYSPTDYEFEFDSQQVHQEM